MDGMLCFAIFVVIAFVFDPSILARFACVFTFLGGFVVKCAKVRVLMYVRYWILLAPLMNLMKSCASQRTSPPFSHVLHKSYALAN